VDVRALDGGVVVLERWWCCGGMARCLLDVHFLLAVAGRPRYLTSTTDRQTGLKLADQIGL
jgi:hypothetical protein